MAINLYYRAEVTCQYDEQDAGYRCDCSAAQESIEVGEMPPESARDAYAHHFRRMGWQIAPPLVNLCPKHNPHKGA